VEISHLAVTEAGDRQDSDRQNNGYFASLKFLLPCGLRRSFKLPTKQLQCVLPPGMRLNLELHGRNRASLFSTL
jgi:hypothetical protein